MRYHLNSDTKQILPIFGFAVNPEKTETTNYSLLNSIQVT